MGLEDKARKLAEQKKDQAPINWDAEREWWLEELRKLHANVRQWLSSLVQENLVDIRSTPVRLSEEHIGAYAADALVLEFTGQGIVLEPKGTVIVGARGRVDVFLRGQRGAQPVMLILGGPKDAAYWSIWPTRDPGTRQTLDESTFKSLLDALL